MQKECWSLEIFTESGWKVLAYYETREKAENAIPSGGIVVNPDLYGVFDCSVKPL